MKTCVLELGPADCLETEGQEGGWTTAPPAGQHTSFINYYY